VAETTPDDFDAAMELVDSAELARLRERLARLEAFRARALTIPNVLCSGPGGCGCPGECVEFMAGYCCGGGKAQRILDDQEGE